MSKDVQAVRHTETIILLITVLIIDGVAVGLWLYLSAVLNWSGTAALIPVVIIAAVSGFCFTAKMQKINGM